MQLQKTSALRNLLIFYIQGSPFLCQPFFHFFPNKLIHTQTFLRLQPKWAPEEELCLNNNSVFRGRNSAKFRTVWIIVIRMSSLFIHITNFKITITNLNSKFYICYVKSWYFLNNWVSNFLEERSSTMRFLLIQFQNEELLKSISSIWCIVLHDLS